MAEGGDDSLDNIDHNQNTLCEDSLFPALDSVENVIQAISEDMNNRCDEELQHHRNCGQPDAPPCILEQTLKSFDTAVRVDQITQQATSIRNSVKGVIQLIQDKIESVDPLFKSHMHCKGSSFNGLKIGRPDEFDFMLELVNFSMENSDRWKVVSDNKDYIRSASIHGLNNMNRKQAAGLENVYQIQLLKSECQQAPSCNCDMCSETGKAAMQPTDKGTSDKVHNDKFLTKRKILGQCLDASEIKDIFATLINRACSLLSATEDLTDERGIRVSMLEASKLLLILPDIAYAVKVDLTPCIRAKPNGSTVFLVPSMRFDTWQVANEDPATLGIERVSQTIRVFKALKDIIEYGEKELDFDSSCLSEDVVFLFQESSCNKKLVLQDLVSRMLIDLCSLPVLGQLKSSLPSYGIMGTVTKCFRKHPDFSVCALIYESIKTFEFVDPKDTPLLTMEWKGHEINMKYILYDMVSTLKDLHMGHDTLQPLLKHNLPPWFKSEDQALAKYMRKNFEPSETILWEGRKPTKNVSTDESKTLRGKDFTAVLDGSGDAEFKPHQTKYSTKLNSTLEKQVLDTVSASGWQRSQWSGEDAAPELTQPAVTVNEPPVANVGISLAAEDTNEDHFEVYQLKKQDFVQVLAKFPLLEAVASIIDKTDGDEESEALFVVLMKPADFCVTNVCFSLEEGFGPVEGDSIKTVLETFTRHSASNTVVIESKECFLFPGLS